MKVLRYRAWILVVCVAVSVWQAYTGLSSMFDPTMSQQGRKLGWVWLVAGPVSFFLAAAMGAIFALLGRLAKTRAIRRYWGLILWLPIAWLGLSASLFVWAEWVGSNFGFTIGEHVLHACLILAPMVVTLACIWTIQRGSWESNSETLVASGQNLDGQAPLFRRKATSAVLRWFGALLATGGTILAVFASGLMLLLWGCDPPSVRTLADRFPGERKDLEMIVAMSDQDREMAVVDPGWLELQGQYSPSDKAIGISQARWEEYRKVFRRNGFTQGIRRYAPGGDAFIIVKSIGILDNGYSNGYLYCVPGTEHRYTPCSSNDQHGEREQVGGQGGYEFIKLSDHWYAYRDGPG